MNKEMCNLRMLRIRSSLVMYKYIALVDVFRILEAPQNVFFLFFIFVVFMYTCIGPTRTVPKKGPVFPPLLTKIHIFLIYMSRIELEDTSAIKRSVCEIDCYRFESFDKSVLGNPKKYTHTAYAIYCLK